MYIQIIKFDSWVPYDTNNFIEYSLREEKCRFRQLVGISSRHWRSEASSREETMCEIRMVARERFY